jgi:hypothetical protein
MKLKNNSVGPKVIHYVSTQGGRKNITIESNEVVEINDCDKIINEHEIEHQWVLVVDATNSSEDKMEKATKDVESYMSESDEKSESKKSSKKK